MEILHLKLEMIITTTKLIFLLESPQGQTYVEPNPNSTQNTPENPPQITESSFFETCIERRQNLS